ncbi:hypothetical protein BBI01_17075 [Chryseobacterium artocarpi]|uniref:Uncharacterized protein n=2 Tax=Chryseobacterium artocarpi TaxID=1414727 RepID=A0A1B8ZBG4_9FLAO|nr:hypothetical protein BBI01_17075 [Chryseobacterium artocarpi]
MYDNRLYTGYVIFDKFPSGTTEAEIEYDCGSRIGWENEYNEAGFLTYSSYSMRQTTKEIYKYDDEGNLINHHKL